MASTENVTKAPVVAKAPAAAKDDDVVRFGVRDYVRNGSHAVELAGLLAHDPDLHDAELTGDEWDKALEDYLNSPRLASGDEPEPTEELEAAEPAVEPV